MPSSQVPLSIDADLFAELQGMAEPLVDDVSSVIRRLLLATEPSRVPGRVERTWFRTSRGDLLEVGLQLRAVFQGRAFDAVITEGGIEFDGRTYDTPSAAARAVKLSLGLPLQAAQSNGWEFWDYLQRSLGAWARLATLRGADTDDAAARLPSRVSVRERNTSFGSGASGRTDISVRIGDERPEPSLWR